MICLQYNKPSELAVPEGLEVLSDSTETLVSRAYRYYYSCNFQRCHDLTTQSV